MCRIYNDAKDKEHGCYVRPCWRSYRESPMAPTAENVNSLPKDCRDHIRRGLEKRGAA